MLKSILYKYYYLTLKTIANTVPTIKTMPSAKEVKGDTHLDDGKLKLNLSSHTVHTSATTTKDDELPMGGGAEDCCSPADLLQ